MAISPSHKFGQIIGDLLEVAIEPLLQDFADKNSLYLDKKGKRKARRGRKVTWVDLNGNSHDLDFVLERGGTEETIGTPVAFIETAWRRYTKHSRNKAQEIQGAILPLAAKYKNNSPFIGAILAGVFTPGAIDQLKSLGFSVLYFSYNAMIEAFDTVGIDARFNEDTPDSEFQHKISQWESLSKEQQQSIISTLLKSNAEEINKFMHTLTIMANRRIEKIRLLPLHGLVYECDSVNDAVQYLESYNITSCDYPLTRFEIEIQYSNGDKMSNSFTDKTILIQFLNSYLPFP
ncbi:MAG: DNA methylase [Chloroflexi bacterium]|nr:DNA methylase [Chloroflexota bacterium]